MRERIQRARETHQITDTSDSIFLVKNPLGSLRKYLYLAAVPVRVTPGNQLSSTASNMAISYLLIMALAHSPGYSAEASAIAS